MHLQWWQNLTEYSEKKHPMNQEPAEQYRTKLDMCRAKLGGGNCEVSGSQSKMATILSLLNILGAGMDEKNGFDGYWPGRSC